MRTAIRTSAALVLILGVVAQSAFAGQTTRVSVSSAGVQAGNASVTRAGRSVTDDGRFVVFQSLATNLVAGDTNTATDVFVHDRGDRSLTRASVSSTGVQGNSSSSNAVISFDGRFVAFESFAQNLVAGDTNLVADVFLRDRTAGTTVRASVGTGGVQGNGASTGADVSADGTRVAFRSTATNLVPGDTNGVADVFVRDLVAATTTRVSVSSAGEQGNGLSSAPAISANGRIVAFESAANNLVPDDTNGNTDVFVRDLDAGTTMRVSVASDGSQAHDNSFAPVISADGRYVAFQSGAWDLIPDDTNATVDVFVHDRLTGSTTRVSVGQLGVQGNGASIAPALSADGRFVAFQSVASNLVFPDTNGVADVFVHDRDQGTTLRVSVGPGGVQAGGASSAAGLSADGTAVAFTSAAANLVTGDTNSQTDVFLRGAACGDGGLDPGEQCDDGNLIDGDGCTSTCRVKRCGDGVLEPGEEECDDGNEVDGDGCDSNCTVTGCGNGILTDGELCDDANLVDGDSCDTNCTPTGCGNGVVTAGELCDDGNDVDGDGCDGNCTPTACGNGITTAGEACDDANAVDGDGCDSNCTTTGCGNGIATAGEACDDGNAIDGDGCDRNCTPTGCGNGIATAGEVCDDGNAVDGDGCDSNCTATGCGNGIVTVGEACDDGNAVDGDGCDSNCTPTSCGNGIVTTGERCDDGNRTGGDGCEADCTVTLCVGGKPIEDGSIVIEDIGSPEGERLTFRGRLALPASSLRGWDPSQRGAQVQIVDLGAGGASLLDLTRSTCPVPPGGPGTGCDRQRDGWRRGRRTKMDLYKNRSDALDMPACTPGTAAGLKMVQFQDRRPQKGDITFGFMVRRTHFAMPAGQLRATVVLGATARDGLTGACGTRVFTCAARGSSTTLVCR